MNLQPIRLGALLLPTGAKSILKIPPCVGIAALARLENSCTGPRTSSILVVLLVLLLLTRKPNLFSILCICPP